MTIQPPPSSARLLKRLVPNENHEALLGDLCEEYQRDRSLLWYRAQILAAIVIGSLGNVRTHWVLSMRAMTLGAATFLAYFIKPLFAVGVLAGGYAATLRSRPA